MRLSLGCGEVRFEDAIHVDINERSAPDVVHDLNVIPWPWEDEQFDEVIGEDIIEHLDSVVGTVEEAHRVLRTGGVLKLRTPHFQSLNSWIDPTHKWHLTEHSFDYFDPDTGFGQKYAYYSPCKFKITRKHVNRGGNIELEMVKR